MNSNKVFHERQCRVCMIKQENLFDIDGVLSEETPNLQIFETLTAVVPQLMFQLNDGLPEQICCSCLYKLQISYQFQQTCIASDKCLRETMNSKEQPDDIIKVEPPDRNTADSPTYINENETGHSIKIKEEPEDEFISLPVDTGICNNIEIAMLHQITVTENDATQNMSLSPNNSTYNLEPTTNELMATIYELPKDGFEYPHKCQHCPKLFAHEIDLMVHIGLQHGSKMVNLACPKIRKSNLKRRLVAKVPKKFLCSECDKVFSHRRGLSDHLLRHSGERRYQCQLCPSKFSCRTDVTKHQAVHRKTKVYVCDICGVCCGRSDSLKKHKEIHLGSRPHKCEKCNMTFICSGTLKRHMLTHTGERPHKCKFCDQSYAASGDLTKHLRFHVGQNTYICKECPRAFKYRKELREHEMEHYQAARKHQQVESNDDDIKSGSEQLHSEKLR